MGAALIEKHFTYDPSLEKSPDHRLSADTAEMAEIVERTRDVDRAMGQAEKGPIEIERYGVERARRSLVTDRAFEAGERIRSADLTVKRPGWGIEPKQLPRADVDGWRAAEAIESDTTLTWELVDGADRGAESSSGEENAGRDTGASRRERSP
jgi:sialic acid synthase SpsE